MWNQVWGEKWKWERCKSSTVWCQRGYVTCSRSAAAKLDLRFPDSQTNAHKAFCCSLFVGGTSCWAGSSSSTSGWSHEPGNVSIDKGRLLSFCSLLPPAVWPEFFFLFLSKNIKTWTNIILFFFSLNLEASGFFSPESWSKPLEVRSPGPSTPSSLLLAFSSSSSPPG